MGAFLAKFSTTPSEKTMDETRKRIWPKMMARTTKITLVGRRLLWCVVDLLPQDIASVFVGQFRCGLQRFLGEEKPFPANGTVFKIVARWRYDWCQNSRKNWKSEKMVAKFVRTTTEYQISNREFSDFLRTCYCNFFNNVYSYGSFFSCGNGWWQTGPAGIAVTRSSHCFWF